MVTWILLAIAACLQGQGGDAPAPEQGLDVLLVEAALRDEKAEEALDPLVRSHRLRVAHALDKILRSGIEARLDGDESRGASALAAGRLIAESYNRLFENRALNARTALIAGWTKPESEQWIGLSRRREAAAAAVAAGDPKSAESKLREALAISEALGDRLEKARVLLFHSKVLYRQGRSREALAPAAESQALFAAEEDAEGVFDALILIADHHDALEEYDAAQAAVESAGALAADLADPACRARVMTVAGRLQFRRGSIETALSTYREVLSVYDDLADEAGRALCLNNMGAFCLHLGRYQEALQCLNGALAVYERQGHKMFAANSRANLGSLYLALGDHRRALDCFGRARETLDEIGSPIDRANCLHNIAACYQQMGDPVKCLAAYEELLQLWRAAGNISGEATTLKNAGMQLRDLERYDEARAALEEALRLFEQLQDAHGICVVLRSLGLLCIKTGEPQKALAYFDRAVPLARRSGSPQQEAEILLNRAALHVDAGDFLEAVRVAEDAFSLLDSVQAGISAPSLKVDYVSRVEELTDPYLHALWRLHLENPKAGYDRRGFERIERWKSRVLLDLLHEDSRLSAAGAGAAHRAGAAELAREAELLRTLAAEISRLRGLAPENAGRRALEERIRRIQDDIDAVRDQIAAANPRYAAANSPRPLDSRVVQTEGLDERTLLLEYKLAGERSYLFAVTTDRFKMFPLPAAAEIEAAVRYFLRLLHHAPAADIPPQELGAVSHELYLQILAPALDDPGLDRPCLVIVPEGMLAALPFEALATGLDDAAADDYGRMHFLLEKKCVFYAPSAAVYAQLNQLSGQSEKEQDARLLAVANPAAGTSADGFFNSLARPDETSPATGADTAAPFGRHLPGTLREIDAIAKLFVQTDVLAGEGATEAALKAPGGLDGHTIVHIACHGLCHTGEPRLSGLLLAADPDDIEDGLLLMIEVLGLRVTAELVVLSGCRTAVGKHVRGEGVIGLPWAFLCAGARSVVVSLWTVEDDATASLMEAFYRGLIREKLGRAEALRRAKLTLLRGGHPAPQTWAPFILIGAAREI